MNVCENKTVKNSSSGSDRALRWQSPKLVVATEGSAEDREKIKARFLSRVMQTSDGQCWEWRGSKNARGYGLLNLTTTDGTTKAVRAHRVSYWLYLAPIPDGKIVCHHCDNPGCCNPHHLFLGTDADNVRDRENKLRGGTAKISPKTAMEIYKAKGKGRPASQIATAYRLNKSTVLQIWRKEIWKRIHTNKG